VIKPRSTRNRRNVIKPRSTRWQEHTAMAWDQTHSSQIFSNLQQSKILGRYYMNRKLKYGMIGGGEGSLIGDAHRRAAEMTNKYELMCGCFSSDPEKSRQFGMQLGLSVDKSYGSWTDLIDHEKDIDVIIVVTPNHLHFEPAKLAIERGIHVVIDKPVTYSLYEAEELKRLALDSGSKICVTYTYAGYAMVKEVRRRIAVGDIGKIHKVIVEYMQGWLKGPIPDERQKAAAWRMDPSQSGVGGTVADIGSHAFHLAEYVTGSKIQRISGALNTNVDGHQLDDDASALVQLNNGASGVILVSQSATGEGNALTLRVYGTTGGLEWNVSTADTLIIKRPGKPHEMVTIDDTDVDGRKYGRSTDHLTAFASIYSEYARAVNDHKKGVGNTQTEYDYPTIDDGIRGMSFIESMVKSTTDTKWIEITTE